jgi:hypothetical protein
VPASGRSEPPCRASHRPPSPTRPRRADGVGRLT